MLRRFRKGSPRAAACRYTESDLRGSNKGQVRQSFVPGARVLGEAQAQPGGTGVKPSPVSSLTIPGAMRRSRSDHGGEDAQCKGASHAKHVPRKWLASGLPKFLQYGGGSEYTALRKQDTLLTSPDRAAGAIRAYSFYIHFPVRQFSKSFDFFLRHPQDSHGVNSEISFSIRLPHLWQTSRTVQWRLTTIP